jgi:hypothetical protein
MSPTLNVVLNHVDRLDSQDLSTLERAIQARKRLLAARKPPGAAGRPAGAESPELLKQSRLFESTWGGEE